MRWIRVKKSDPAVCALSNRHYPPRRIGAKQAGPPGALLTLRTGSGDAFWMTHWPDYPKHAFGDAWICSRFRNENRATLSSELILEGMAATRAVFGGLVPFITFIDPEAIRSKRDPGRCFRRAGFEELGWTPGGHGRPRLLVLGCAVDRIPPPCAPLALQLSIEIAIR